MSWIGGQPLWVKVKSTNVKLAQTSDTLLFSKNLPTCIVFPQEEQPHIHPVIIFLILWILSITDKPANNVQLSLDTKSKMPVFALVGLLLFGVCVLMFQLQCGYFFSMLNCCMYQLMFVIPAVDSSAVVYDDVKASRFEGQWVGFFKDCMIHHSNMMTNKQIHADLASLKIFLMTCLFRRNLSMILPYKIHVSSIYSSFHLMFIPFGFY